MLSRSMRHMRSLPTSAMFAALVATSPARADDPPPMRDAARTLLEAGMARFEAGDFAGAAEKFAEARTIDPHRDLFYAEAQAQRRGGHCEAAIPLYEAFLQAGPPEAEASLARGNMSQCKVIAPNTAVVPVRPDASGDSPTFMPPPSPTPEPAALPPPSPPETTPVAAPAPGPAALAPTRDARRDGEAASGHAFWQDGWFWGALAVGTTGTATGFALLGAADGEARSANDARTLDAFVDGRGAHDDLSTAGSVVLVVGSGFLLLATVRALWTGATPSAAATTTARGAPPSLSFPFGS